MVVCMAVVRAGSKTRTSNYITPEGFKRLRDELDFLWRVERPKVTQAVSLAAAQGDRSENAEYIYGKKQLREIDSRVRFLRKRLDGMTVVDKPPADTGRIFFGAWVTLEDISGQQLIYRIVGPDEIDPEHGYISIDSPAAKALLKKQVDEEAVIQTPKGEQIWTITAIRYNQAETQS